jgi:hypothetical protein
MHLGTPLIFSKPDILPRITILCLLGDIEDVDNLNGVTLEMPEVSSRSALEISSVSVRPEPVQEKLPHCRRVKI